MDAENYDENIHVTFKIQDADYATFYHTTLTPSGLSDDEIVEFAFGRNEASEDNEWFYIPSDWEGVGEHYLAKIMSKTSEAESFGADTTPTFIKWFEESEGPHCWTCGKENPQGHFEGVDNICEPCHSKWIYDEGGPEGEGYYLVSTLNEEQRKFFKMDAEAESFGAEYCEECSYREHDSCPIIEGCPCCDNTRRAMMDAEEGNAPIQDPMEFGEMANWTPLDGSEGLKRKRAESIEVTESDTEHWLGTDNMLSEAIEVITDIANGEYKSQTLRQDILSTKEAYLGEAESPQHRVSELSIYGRGPPTERVVFGRHQYGTDKPSKPIYPKNSPSATNPVNEPSWVKPVATALGFALGFFGIHEIKKVL